MMQDHSKPIFAGLAAALALVLVGAAILSWPAHDGPNEDALATRTILIPVPSSYAGQRPQGRVMPTIPPLSVGGEMPANSVDRRILTTLGAHDARIRYLKAADGGGAMYCGEISTQDHPNYRQFLWMDAVHMLAMDDGSPDFTDIAKACNNGGTTS